MSISVTTSLDPILLFKAVRSSVNTVGVWVPISEELTQRVRCAQVFSAVHGFLGLPKLIVHLRSSSSTYTISLVWKITKVAKKFVSSIAWFCKVGGDAGYFSARYVTWTLAVSAVHVPYQSVSLGASLIKAYKVCKVWLDLHKRLAISQESEKLSIIEQQKRLQHKAIKVSLHIGGKAFSIVCFCLERLCPEAIVLISLNSLVLTAIKITAFVYSLKNSSKK